jgi:hypothetical protein
MHDSFESLLTRCKAYQRKQMLTRLGWGSMAFLVLLGLFGLYQYGDFLNEETPNVEKKVLAAQKTQKVETIIQKPKIEVVEANVVETQSQGVARKDIDYELNIDESYLTSMPQKETPKTPKVIAVKPKVVIQKDREEKPLHVKPKTPQQTLTVSTKKLVSIDDLNRQYEKEPQYDLALKISQAYYDENKFSKASSWAKKANMIDRERDGAWIMYAKSEYARGYKDRAKDILSLYLANKRSKDVEMLLMTWNQEK